MTKINSHIQMPKCVLKILWIIVKDCIIIVLKLKI